MLISTLLSLGSLLLGLIAWIVPFLAMKHPRKDAVKNCSFIIVSFSACVASLCLQLFEINHRVQIQDWSALMDTIGTLIWVAVILAVITLILNIIYNGVIYMQ
ncbi:hypothetical protein [Clostridium formicaceticum]|uniref:Cytochrome c oxidase subunit 4 n=1 Tax=Clostridium formicaceticum TaxID=1497 RepID=A0AAC9WHG2_9CLOT|nr:hypothetical protein [Clostridium formicaceticum]AOY74550.1 hypothetical protein BJL90_00420 [Clostridium formicaceticum]ARE88906.1 hypothetical protein CLFO_33120 [Clostridium formicaceticum]